MEKLTQRIPIRIGPSASVNADTQHGESPCRGKPIPVVEGNCVAVKQGGEQPKTNWRSAGDELDSAGSDGELAAT